MTADDLRGNEIHLAARLARREGLPDELLGSALDSLLAAAAQAVRRLSDDNGRLRAANAALATALGPFAEYARAVDATEFGRLVGDNYAIALTEDGKYVTRGDCRRAADALAAHGDPT